MALWKSIPVKETPIGGFRGVYESLPATSRPLNVPSVVSNLVLDPAPSLTTRPGLTLLGSAVSAAVTRGIHQFINIAGTTVQTLAQAGTQLSRWDGSAWQSITSIAPAKAFTGANLNDLACLFYAGSAPQKWDGTTLGTLGGSPPQGEFAVEAYEQIFVCGIPGREGDVDFCDVALPETWAPTATNDAGSITVSQSPTKWVDFDRDQGKVLVWTTREAIQINGPETPNRPQLWATRSFSPYGTPNGRTVQKVRGVWMWLTNNSERKGFAMWGGADTQVAVEPIADSIALIDWSNVTNGASWLDKKGRYVCSVPKSGGGTLWFTYDATLAQWYVGSGPSIRASGILTASGQDVFVVGDEVGEISSVGGSDDAGDAIAWSVEIGPSTMDNPFVGKQITRVDVVLSKGASATANLSVSTTETGSYGTAKVLSAGTTFSQLRVPVPVAKGDAVRSGVFRLKINGTGDVTIHDVLVTTYESGR
jgi:hypothetical protein